MKRCWISIVCLCYVMLTLAASAPAGAIAPDYELSILYAQTFPAGTTAYDPSAPLRENELPIFPDAPSPHENELPALPDAPSPHENELPVLSGASAGASAKQGEIVVLTVGFKNNTASAVQIGAFGAQLAYDKNKLEIYPLFGNNAYQMGDNFSSGWMSSPNVKEANAFVNMTAMAAGDAYTVAAHSQAVIARFAFHVKSGSADSVTQFTFDAAKSYVADGANKRFALGDFPPFTLTVSDGASTPASDPGNSGDSVTPTPAPTPTGDYEPTGDYGLSVLYAQTFPAGTTAYDASAASTTSAKSGEIVVLTVGFKNNAASAVQIGAFGAQLAYDKNKLEIYPLFGNNAYQMGDNFSSGWMSSPNVKEANAFVNMTAMAAGDAYTVAANSQVIMARFAFQVKSDAADGATQFTFNNAKSYVADGVNKRLTLGDFTPFTLTISGNSSAHEYALDKLTIVGGEIGVEVTNLSGAGGVLMIAAYSESGKFLRCAMETVTESRIARGSAGNVAVTLDVSGAKTVRAFLLDAETQRPLSRICSETAQ